MYTPEELQVIDDLKSWLHTAPSFEDIDYYIRHLPDGSDYLVFTACDDFFEQMANEKLEYYSKNNLSTIDLVVDELTQISLLANLALYSGNSVIQNYVQKSPELATITLPGDIAGWAKQYTSMWFSLTQLVSRRACISLEILLTSLVRELDTDDEIAELLKVVKEYVLISERAFSDGEDFSQQQIAEFRNRIRELRFLPEVLIGSLTDPAIDLETNTFTRHMISSLEILSATTLAEGKKDEEILLEVAQEHQRIIAENSYVKSLESLRLARKIPENQSSNFFDMYEKIWTIENVENKLVEQKFEETYVSIPEPSRIPFLQSYRAYLSEAPLIAVLLMPFSQRYVLNRMRNVREYINVEMLIQQLREERTANNTEEFFLTTVRTIIDQMKRYPYLAS